MSVELKTSDNPLAGFDLSKVPESRRRPQDSADYQISARCGFCDMRDLEDNPFYESLKKINANPDLNYHLYDVFQFGEYLKQTALSSFRIKGVNRYSGELVAKSIPYIHRWTVPYRKSILAKFYKLEEWMKENPRPVTMITLTTYQDGDYSKKIKGQALSPYESLDLLMTSYTKLRELITNRIKRKAEDFFYVLEPHTKRDAGYAHMHLIYFCEFSEAEQVRIKQMWEQKYKAGSFSKGVDFSFRKPEGSIKSIRNYLMKYVSKGFLDDGSKFNTEKWTPGQTIFNTVLWGTKTRLWNCSRNLSRVMAPDKNSIVVDDGEHKFKIPKPAVPPVIWLKTVLRFSDSGDSHECWKADDDRFRAASEAIERAKLLASQGLAYMQTFGRGKWRLKLEKLKKFDGIEAASFWDPLPYYGVKL